MQILLGISDLHLDGLLGACKHNGLLTVLDQIGKCCHCVGHGVRPMADHKAIIFFIIFFNFLHQLQPVNTAHIGAVQIAHLHRRQLDRISHVRKVGKDLLCTEHRLQALFCLHRGNGSSCKQQ